VPFLPPTGQRYRHPEQPRKHVDGRLVEHYGVFDALGLLQQIGAIPTP